MIQTESPQRPIVNIKDVRHSVLISTLFKVQVYFSISEQLLVTVRIRNFSFKKPQSLKNKSCTQPHILSAM